MALTKDDKQYFELLLTPIIQHLENIDKHLAKQNGKVNRNTDNINKALVERATNRAEHLDALEDIDDLKKKVVCLDDGLMEYKMVKKYPKFMMAAMVIFGIMTVAVGLHSVGLF